MRRIAKTAFPGRYTVRGSLRYIAVPIITEERMGLKDGDFLDVVIRWPRTEEYEDSVSGDTEEQKREHKKE